jgi:hypothetical protein
MRVVVAGVDEPAFERALGERGALVLPALAHGMDLAFLMAGGLADLERIAELRPFLTDAGAIWVLRVKGAARTLREVDVIDAGRRFGMVDNKIASFSQTLAAMRLVIPLALRGRRIP